MASPHGGRNGRGAPARTSLLLIAMLAAGCAAPRDAPPTGPGDRVATAPPASLDARTDPSAATTDPMSHDDRADPVPAPQPTTTDGAARNGTLRRAGRLLAPALTETSGLAVSARGDDVLWALNDSGHRAELHALDGTGRALAVVPIDTANRDWEALDSGTLDGIASLIIGETGDNTRRRDRAELLVLAEPDVVAPSEPAIQPHEPVTPRRIAFVWPEPGHDVEAMSLDAGTLWMLDKPPLAATGAGQPSGVFRLDLERALTRGPNDAPLEAVRVGEYRSPGRGLLGGLAAGLFGVDLGHPTGLELDAARGHAWVLTYRDVLRYDRVADEPWQTTLSREPARRWSHGLPQAEALALGADGAVYLTSEGAGARLLRIDTE